MNPKLIATGFLAVVALGVAAYVALGGKRTSGRGGRASDRDRKRPSGFLNPNGTGEVELYVGNLSFDMTDSDLRSEFAKFGVVSDAHVVTNRDNGRSKGFGFVHMPNRAEADAAVKALNDKLILGRNMKCNQARNA